MENILEKFLLELNDGQIRYKTFFHFLDEYEGALLYIKSNYDMILANIYSYDYIMVVDAIYKDERLRDVAELNFIETMHNCSTSTFLPVLLNIYLENKNYIQKREFLKNYFPYLVKSFEGNALTGLLEYKDLDPSFYRALNEKISSNKHRYIKENIRYKQLEGIDIQNETDFDTFISVLVLIIDELLEEENSICDTPISYADISFDEGTYSLVLLIGDKVLSVGNRKTYMIPNHRRILQPLIRPNISRLLSSKVSIYTTMIDVSERVDTESEISEEDLYLVYKELRDCNILWTDVKRENVGRLLKSNIVHYSKTLAVDDSVKGFTRELDSGTEVLGIGEVVIIDKDFIYDLNYFDIQDVDYWSELATSFEKKYQLEKESNQDKKL